MYIQLFHGTTKGLSVLFCFTLTSLERLCHCLVSATTVCKTSSQPQSGKEEKELELCTYVYSVAFEHCNASSNGFQSFQDWI